MGAMTAPPIGPSSANARVMATAPLMTASLMRAAFMAVNRRMRTWRDAPSASSSAPSNTEPNPPMPWPTLLKVSPAAVARSLMASRLLTMAFCSASTSSGDFNLGN